MVIVMEKHTSESNVEHVVAELRRDRVAPLGPVEGHAQQVLARLVEQKRLIAQVLHGVALGAG